MHGRRPVTLSAGRQCTVKMMSVPSRHHHFPYGFRIDILEVFSSVVHITSLALSSMIGFRTKMPSSEPWSWSQGMVNVNRANISEHRASTCSSFLHSPTSDVRGGSTMEIGFPRGFARIILWTLSWDFNLLYPSPQEASHLKGKWKSRRKFR